LNERSSKANRSKEKRNEIKGEKGLEKNELQKSEREIHRTNPKRMELDEN
jgi:hypothetical protein